MAFQTTMTVADSSERAVSLTVAALTTTFTPPAWCTEHRLTMHPPVYEIWINDPQPVEAERMSDCYPSQWIEQYTSSAGWTQSVAPMMSPLVCPSGWTTVGKFTIADYIACCPIDFGLTPPNTTEHPLLDSSRPAWGGTCFSELTSGATYSVTSYDKTSSIGPKPWTALNPIDHAYAHPIDGYRAATALPTATSGSSGAPARSTAAASGAAAAAGTDGTPGDNDASASLPGGAIAGIVIGVVGGLALIAAAVFFLFRRRRQQQQHAKLEPEAAAGDGSAEVHTEDKKNAGVYEAPESLYYPPGELHAHQRAAGELANNQYVAELGPSERAELPSNYHGQELR